MTADGPVLVIGGTRGTGLLIAQLLIERKRAVRILARDPARARRAIAAEVIPGDITDEATLAPAIAGAAHIIFTAGCRSGRPVLQSKVRRTEYGGVVNTLAAAKRAGFTGRFLYMTAGGFNQRSFWTFALNTYKGNTLHWRRRAEEAIRASALPYTIIRTGVLLNAPGGMHAIHVTQQPLPLSPRYRIARADVAEAFVAALDHPRTVRATLELAWAKGSAQRNWAGQFDGLAPDSAVSSGSR